MRHGKKAGLSLSQHCQANDKIFRGYEKVRNLYGRLCRFTNRGGFFGLINMVMQRKRKEKKEQNKWVYELAVLPRNKGLFLLVTTSF